VVKTSSSSVRLGYEDGSEVLLGEDSEVSIGTQTAEDGREVPLVELIHGKLWALINKIRSGDQDEDSHKFYIKDQNAALGVRGTEFFVTSEKGKSIQVETFEGKVDVAESLENLRKGEVVSLAEGKKIERRAGQRLGRGENFKLQERLSQLQSRNPRMARLHTRVLQEKRSGESQKQFQRVKKQNLDKVRLHRAQEKVQRMKSEDSRVRPTAPREDRGRVERKQNQNATSQRKEERSSRGNQRPGRESNRQKSDDREKRKGGLNPSRRPDQPQQRERQRQRMRPPRPRLPPPPPPGP